MRTITKYALCSGLVLAGGLLLAPELVHSHRAADSASEAGAAQQLVRCGTNLANVSATAGTTYALEDGCTYSGAGNSQGTLLNVAANNVTITSYGSGNLPVIKHNGSYGSDIAVSGKGDKIENVRLTGTGYSGQGDNDYEIGVDVTGSNDTFYNLKFEGAGNPPAPDPLYAGIYLESSASNNTVNDIYVNDVDALNPSNLGSGAFGVLLWGSNNTIKNSTFNNQDVKSSVYGYDGSGVEVYGSASNNLIEGNTGYNDNSFSELGTDTPSKAPTGNQYLDNKYTGAKSGDEGFITTRGSGDTANGPVHDTIMKGNTVTNAQTTSYAWKNGDGTLLSLANNTFNDPGHTALSSDGGCVNSGGNHVKAGSVQGGCIPS